MGGDSGETDEEERETEPSPAATPAFISTKSKVTRSRLDKFKELSQKLLQIKDTNDQKIKLKGNSNKRKMPCLEIESKVKDASVPIKCTEPEKLQVLEPAQLEEQEPRTQKYKRKLHWGLDTKERWERKSNM